MLNALIKSLILMSFPLDGDRKRPQNSDSELMRMVIEEDFITFHHCDSLKSYMLHLVFYISSW